MSLARAVNPNENETSTASETVVMVQGLSKVFKDFWGRPKAHAVNNVSFQVRRGEVFGLLGPNGSGKSTTVKLLLGLLNPTRGHIEVFGRSTRHVATKRRIGYLPEESYLYRYMDSAETLDFFGSLFNLPSGERRQRIEQLLEMVGLDKVRRRTVGEFSKGMQRRIGLAQALINDPDLVILDEPTSGLDPIGCREVKDLIVELARRGKTVILSSHLLADVEDVCDRVVIYYGGKIQAMGTLKELLSTPDRLRITMPVLERETLERVLATIRADLGRKFSETEAQESVLVDCPSQNLESYFLDVVKKARSGAEETSGAVSGGTVARYLRSEESERVQAKDRILERLASSKEAPAEAPAPEKKKEEASAVDASKKLSALLSKTTVQAPAEPSAVKEASPASPQSEQRQENLKKASEKLSGLLGNKGNK
ncbi:MAG: ABC transporter ATP-binding protein [Verrucomicrobia bacterium]|nr:ABC transporter ATP-binding protein [Verrucomicrobiota bacterium]MDD4455918.1 ABC transporter ATP-binding protein [Candidatus Methanomethylophilaceae archaeon]NCC59503.1 ABC transporter ATP-binding protein [Verrucomicrobiae bacterium]